MRIMWLALYEKNDVLIYWYMRHSAGVILGYKRTNPSIKTLLYFVNY